MGRPGGQAGAAIGDHAIRAILGVRSPSSPPPAFSRVTTGRDRAVRTVNFHGRLFPGRMCRSVGVPCHIRGTDARCMSMFVEALLCRPGKRRPLATAVNTLGLALWRLHQRGTLFETCDAVFRVRRYRLRQPCLPQFSYAHGRSAPTCRARQHGGSETIGEGLRHAQSTSVFPCLCSVLASWSLDGGRPCRSVRTGDTYGGVRQGTPSA